MIVRFFLLASLSFVFTACATYGGGRGIPAPVESRDNVGMPSAVTPSHANTADAPGAAAIQRREIPEDTSPSARPPTAISPRTPETPTTASGRLLQSVDAAIAQGDLERAAALCERALRISPRDALLWYRLAGIRAQQGRTDEAQGFAQRALSFSRQDAQLERQIQTLLNELQ